MGKSAALLTLLLGAFSFVGCARRPEMGLAGRDGGLARPMRGKALVLFIRPDEYFGKAIATSLYDGDEFVGIHTTNTVVAYQAAPRPHLFMLLSGAPAAPAFLQADLLPGKIYYVHIAARSKWTRPPFHLVPLNPQRQRETIDAWLREGSLLVIDERARQWDQQNRPSVQEKREEGLRAWGALSEAERPTIRPGDGVDADSRAQRVIRQDDHRTGVNERRRDEGQIALVERSPPAAVDENEDRRVGAGRREDVERLVGPVAVRNVESTRQTFARKRRRLLPALEDLRMLGDARASAVLGIQPCGVEPGHEAPPKSEQRQQPAF